MLDLENSRLHGTGRIADDLYLIAHHETNGKPYLSTRAVGIGLAGGLLAELLVALRPAVTIDSGRMFPLSERNGEPVARYARPDEPVVQQVPDLIVAESPPRPVRGWLLFLGRTAPADVAGRLERAGYLTRLASWLPWQAGRRVPVEGEWSQCARMRAGNAEPVLPGQAAERLEADYPDGLVAVAHLYSGVGVVAERDGRVLMGPEAEVPREPARAARRGGTA